MTGDERTDRFEPEDSGTEPVEWAPPKPVAAPAEPTPALARPASWPDWPPAPVRGTSPDAAPPAPDPVRPTHSIGSGAPVDRQRSRGVGAGTVFGAALGAAALASIMTFGAIELARPAASAASPAASTTAVATTAAASAPAGALTVASDQSVIAQVAAAAEPSVVTIATEGATGFSPFSVPSSGVGSGIVVSAGGLILTNYHVVSGSTSLTVTLFDGESVPGTVVASDPSKDLAVVKIARTGLTPARLAGGSALKVGQLAIAIGSPLGTFTDTVTQGIVSGLDRSIDVSSDTSPRSVTHLSGLIQTDAAINPGNSGGPLLDSGGYVIGIVTAQASNAQGVGFAIPISAATVLIAQARG